MKKIKIKYQIAFVLQVFLPFYAIMFTFKNVFYDQVTQNSDKLLMLRNYEKKCTCSALHWIESHEKEILL